MHVHRCTLRLLVGQNEGRLSVLSSWLGNAPVVEIAENSFMSAASSVLAEVPASGWAVDAVGLQKRFGNKVAVERVDLRVERGSFFGVVGPNGAGKTTSMRMITCLLKPDAGSARVDGLDVWADPTAAKHRFGVLPDDLRLFERLSGLEMLTYVGLLRRLEPAVARRRAEELLDVLGLTRRLVLVPPCCTCQLCSFWTNRSNRLTRCHRASSKKFSPAIAPQAARLSSRHT
jgi:hypothetical protein